MAYPEQLTVQENHLDTATDDDSRTVNLQEVAGIKVIKIRDVVEATAKNTRMQEKPDVFDLDPTFTRRPSLDASEFEKIRTAWESLSDSDSAGRVFYLCNLLIIDDT